MNTLTDPEQELAAISELLRDYGRFTALGLSEAHFAGARNLAVVQAARRLADSGTQVTLESITLELQRTKLADTMGGIKGLLELRRGPPGVLLDQTRLRSLAALRAVQSRLEAAMELVRQEDLTGALARLDEANAFGAGEVSVLDMRQLVETAMEHALGSARTRKQLLYPGSELLEKVIRGFLPGGMYILGALSNVGKSYLAQSWMIRCAQRGVGVGWISLEDTELTTGSRALGMLAGLEPQSIQVGGSVYADHDKEISAGHGEAMRLGSKFLYADLGGRTELDVCAAMSLMAARGAKIVVVDYIGVVTPSERQQDRRNDMTFIAVRLKSHAKRLGVALLLISQLTMPRTEDGVATEPSKYSLRESGDLTNAAEGILVAWREEESDTAPIIVKYAKGKSGGVGKAWTVKRDETTHMMVDLGMWERPKTEPKKRPAFKV